MKGWVCQMFLEVDSCQPILQKVLSLWYCCWDMAENSQKKNWRGSQNNNKYNNYLKIEQLSMLTSANYFEIDDHLLSLLLFIKINSGTNKEKL